MNTEQQERRRFFRIEDKVNLVYKVVDENTVTALSHVSDDLLSNCSLAAALDAMSQEARIIGARLEKNQPEIFEYLKIIDTKINLLAQALTMQGNQFGEHDSRDVNISASGLAFAADEELQPGRFLEIRIMLTSCMAVIVAYGKVIYCQRNEEGGDYPYFVGVDYVNMKDDDRELLIKHVVKKQMQQIRESK
ncbi:PilZ domain-containing protein [Methylomarinum sp. Ch1-1]|uniref:PilZ domain-containing protein n=1 Tax=Methylomarinum roseum TaxID=3067653 RepID=A0AAU7NRC5_9GAMM|nr:PilZ domain-containing protein [Methylomarinum sp. Ch1-1]MDP4520496.1 PilZ domain-containing protein [Methylomarinum sp. Ch1-1]